MQFPLLRSLRTHVVFLLASMILFTTGCEDDDHDHDHDEDHTDADGFVLEDESGTEVYREFEGAMTGTVTLAVGETLELSVHFLDHEGNEIEHEEGEEEEEHDDELVVSENDASVAVVEVEDHEEGEEEHHEMALHIVGVSTGSTSFKLQLMHEGHADYTSTNNVPVTVN
jgi:activator of 2-hydroxyglutaryl-CoA dehydratase